MAIFNFKYIRTFTQVIATIEIFQLISNIFQKTFNIVVNLTKLELFNKIAIKSKIQKNTFFFNCFFI